MMTGMRTLHCILVLVLLGGPRLRAQDPARDRSRLGDLNYVASQVPQLHLNFFFQLDPADFNNAVQALQTQIPTLTDAEFYVGLAQLVAMAGDEHTNLYLDGAAAANAGFQQFPLLFRWLDDGVFVTAAAAKYSKTVGTQLVRVGNSSIDDVAQLLATVIPHANSQWVRHRAESYLRGQQVLQGLDILPATPTSSLTFRTLAGEEFTLDTGVSADPLVSAPAADQGPLPPYLQNTSLNYWFTYSAPLRLLYFKYNKCAEMPGSPILAFTNDLLASFDANPVDSLVFDFRGNGGGDASIILPLFNGVAARIIQTFLANPKLRVYGVLDKGTFSSAVDDAMFLKMPLPPEVAALLPNLDLSKVVRMIGEPTGGAPGGYGNVLPFTLPNSQLTGQYSTQFFLRPDYIPDGPSFAPDIAVPVRSTDYFARYDPVLAAILARWEGDPPAPSGSAIAVNAASLHPEQGLAPGSLAAALGSFPDNVDAVTVNGQAAQVVSASASLVDFVVPASATPGPAAISLQANGSEVASGQVTITAAGPGIFAAQPTDPAQPGSLLNEDSSPNSASSPAAQGSVVQIQATGYDPSEQVLIGGVPAGSLGGSPVAEFPGRWQINARIPDGVQGQVPLFVIAGGVASNGVTLWVR
jgi:uncharacterized protein (TIGR03437 family)